MKQNKRCTQCGNILDSDSQFCTSCGAKVETTEQIITEAAYDAPPAAVQQPYQQQYSGQAANQFAGQQYQAPYDPNLQQNQPGQYIRQEPAPGQYGQQPYYGQQYPAQKAPVPPQGYPAYPPPYPPAQQGKKKSKTKGWWIAAVALVLVAALAVGAWFLFFNRGKAYASDGEAWRAAEDECFLGKGSLFGSLRSSANKFLDSGKFGFGARFNLIINQLPDMDQASEEMAIINALKNISVRLEGKFDLDSDPMGFSTFLALAKKGSDEDALSLNVFNVGDDLVISIPELFDKPFVFTKEAMEDMMGEIPLDSLFDMAGDTQDNLELFKEEKLEQIFTDIREIFVKYAGEPERIEDAELTVGSVTEKLDYFQTVLPAEQFPEFLKELLLYVKNNEDIKKFAESIINGAQIPFDFEYDAYGGYYGEENISFTEEIDKAIAEIESEPDNYKVELKRELYVDSKNNPRADRIVITSKMENASADESITYEHLVARDGDKGAAKFRFDTQQFGIEFNSEFTENKDLLTGQYTFVVLENRQIVNDVTISGSFVDFGIDKEDDNLYPVGELTLNVKGDEYSPIGEGGIEVSYSGQVKTEAGVRQLQAELLLKGEIDGEAIEVGIEADIYPIEASKIEFSNELPADYINLQDEDALARLTEDPSLLMKLMGILNKLGINMGDFIY